MASKLLEEFLTFCDAYLEDSKGGKEVEKLIKKRFHGCDDEFKNSSEFRRLIDSTRTKIVDDEKRFFVHIKDFVTELKAYGRDSSEREGRSKSNKKPKKRNRESSQSEDSEGPRKKANLGTEKAKASDADMGVAVISGSKAEDSPCSHEVTSTCSPAVSPVRKLKADSGTGVLTAAESCKAIDFSSSELTKVDISECADGPDSKPSEKNPDKWSVKEENEANSSPQAVVLGNLDLAPKRAALQPVKSQSDNFAVKEEDKFVVKEENEAYSSPQAVVLGNLDLVPKRVTLQPMKSETVRASSSDQHKTNNTSKPHAKPSNIKDHHDNASTSFLGERKKAANEKNIRRLEKLLAKLRNEIERVKSKEMSLDDLGDEDSSYIYEDRLQKKFVKVWDKLCELKGRRKTTGRPSEQRFTYEGSRYPEINKKIEKFINKGKIFPDYNDIKDIVIRVNKRKKLNISENMVDVVAGDAFTDVGNRLQERRKEDFLATFGCRLTDNVNPNKEDPALHDSELKEKLESNRKKGEQNLQMLMSRFTHEQVSRGEVPVEVANQSAEETRETSTSPTNEDEEEPEEEVCVPELDEVYEADEDEGCIKEKDDNCEYYDDDDDEDDEVIEISTDEEEDDAQSDDEGDPTLPRTFSSVLENMQNQTDEDSQDIAEIITDNADDNYVADDDNDEPLPITDDCVYMDVADDSDVPDVSALSPITADNTESDSEGSESESSNSKAPFKSPKRSNPSSKLSIRTPQKSLLRSALGLKSPGKGPKFIKFPVRGRVQRIEDESETGSSDIEISSSAPSTQARCKTPENKCENQNIVELRLSSQSSDDVIAITPESSSFPLDDLVISSSTGDPSKGHNSSSDDDVIILD